MPSKRLMATWVVLDFFFLGAGIATVALAIIWNQPNVLLNMVFSNADLTGGLILGIAFLLTFVLSIGAIVQRNHITVGLVALNWMLMLDALGALIVGTTIWFFTLDERANFHKRLVKEPAANMILIQDTFKCCGYFNSSDLVQIGGSFCANQTFVSTTNNATGNFCVGPVTKFADELLNDMFTTIYGFMGIILGLFLASLCVIKRRQEEERFKKIDAKRGGRGFV